MAVGIPAQREANSAPYVSKRSEYRKWLKTSNSRRMRRLAKADPENAPKKRQFYGYEY